MNIGWQIRRVAVVWTVVVMSVASSLASAQYPDVMPELGFDMRADTGVEGAHSSVAPRVVATTDGFAHVVWQDFREENWHIYYRRVSPSTGSFDGSDVKLSTYAGLGGNTVNSTHPQIATDGHDALYVVWHVAGAGLESILFVRSTDGGMSWSTPTLAPHSQLNHGMVSEYAGPPQISADSDGRVHVVWAQSDLFFDQIYLASSLNGGASWTLPELSEPVNSEVLGHSEDPCVGCDGEGGVFVAWLDHRDVDQRDVYVRRSDDFGTTFAGPDERVNKPGTTDFLNLTVHPHTAANGDSVIVAAWIDIQKDADGNAITYVLSNVSRDSGVTWLGEPTAVAAACFQLARGEPLVTTSGPGQGGGSPGGAGGVGVVNVGGVTGTGSVPTASLGDLGMAPNPVRDLSLCTSALYVDLQLDVDDSGRVFAAYSRIDFPLVFEPTRVLSSSFDPFTATWQAEQMLSRAGSTFPFKGVIPSQPRTQVVATDGGTYVVWMHSADGNESYGDINVAWTVDGGATWLGPSGVTTKPDGPGTSRSGFPHVAATGKHAVIVWDDRRSWSLPEDTGITDDIAGAPDVYVNVLTNP